MNINEVGEVVNFTIDGSPIDTIKAGVACELGRAHGFFFVH